MLINFEDKTYELTDHEANTIVPILIKVLNARIGKKQSISAPEMVRNLKLHFGIVTKTERIRKIIHAIRISGAVIHLCASSKGYYRAADKEQLKEFILSLDQRISSIEEIRDNAVYQLNQIGFRI